MTPAEIERVARLAALRVPADDLPVLTAQISRILAYVSRLEAGEDGKAPAPMRAGGPVQPLRDDIARPARPAVPLERIAPAVVDGLLLVPEVGRPEQA